MPKKAEILAVLQAIVEQGVVNCPNTAAQLPLTIAIPAEVFNNACEVCVRAKRKEKQPRKG